VLPLFCVDALKKSDGIPAIVDPGPYLFKLPAETIILPALNHIVDSIMMIVSAIMVFPGEIKLLSVPSCTSRKQC
jgi:hypothetical protein